MRRNVRATSFTTKAMPRGRLHNQVLPDAQKEQLRQICSHIKNYDKDYRIRGINLHRQGAGLKVLFSGPSNTGKTLAANFIAGELDLDLYRVDLSKVISKYIGETEKNIQKIFDRAEEANCLLFFDEADALLGKRTEVKDANDRYANTETNYLLQRIEEYKGIIILAANLTKSVNDQLAKRINYTIKIPPPT